MLLFHAPPHPHDRADTLPERPGPGHVMALDPATGQRWHAIDGQWRPAEHAHPLPPEVVRPKHCPVLRDGIDFAGWVARHGDASARPITLPDHALHFQKEAEVLVRKDGAALAHEEAIEAQADLQMLCTRLAYALDPDRADDPRHGVAYDHPSARFWWLTMTTP